MAPKTAPITPPKAKHARGLSKSISTPSKPSTSSKRASVVLPALPSTPSEARNLGYEAVPPPSPTMDIHSFKGLTLGETSPWRQAADLTTEYESIDPETLQGKNVEPRPKTPPKIRPKPTEPELYSINRSVLIAVAKNADYWYDGPKYMPPNEFDIKQDTAAYTEHCIKAKDDLRYIIEHVGRNDEGKVDKVKAGEFFRRVAASLKEMETGAENGQVDPYSYQIAVAEGLYRAGISLNTDILVVLVEIGTLLKEWKEARKRNSSGSNA